MHLGSLTGEQLDGALRVQARQGGLLGAILVEEGLIDESTLVHALSIQLSVQTCDPVTARPDPALRSLVPRDWAFMFRAVPLQLLDDSPQGALLVATADPRNEVARRQLEARIGRRVRWALAGETEMDLALARHYGVPKPAFLEREAEAPVSPTSDDLVGALIAAAGRSEVVEGEPDREATQRIFVSPHPAPDLIMPPRRIHPEGVRDDGPAEDDTLTERPQQRIETEDLKEVISLALEGRNEQPNPGSSSAPPGRPDVEARLAELRRRFAGGDPSKTLVDAMPAFRPRESLPELRRRESVPDTEVSEPSRIEEDDLTDVLATVHDRGGPGGGSVAEEVERDFERVLAGGELEPKRARRLLRVAVRLLAESGSMNRAALLRVLPKIKNLE